MLSDSAVPELLTSSGICYEEYVMRCLIRREAAAEKVKIKYEGAKTNDINTIPPKNKKVVEAPVIPEKDRS
jgi:hypothetical protein